MSLLAVSITLLIAAAGIAAIGTLVHSYARAFAAYGETRRALASCGDSVEVSVRIVETGRPAGARLRLVRSCAEPRRAVSRPALPAAA